jgi:hypothetical protein
MGAAAPASAPISPPDPSLSVFDVARPGSLRPASGELFRPRQYPAMRVVMMVCYALACLVGVSFIISEIFVISTSAVAAYNSPSLDDVPAEYRARVQTTARAGGVIAFLLVQAMLFLYHGLSALAFVAAAESIKVALDIQNNTHEAAHYCRQVWLKSSA